MLFDPLYFVGRMTGAVITSSNTHIILTEKSRNIIMHGDELKVGNAVATGWSLDVNACDRKIEAEIEEGVGGGREGGGNE